jgi:DNA-binding NarL/FixJ family response regulator
VTVTDWVGLVERIYDLETPSHDAWLNDLMGHITPEISAAEHAVAAIFRVEQAGLHVFSSSAVGELFANHSRALDTVDPGVVATAFHGPTFGTMSSIVGKRRLARASARARARGLTSLDAAESTGLLARDGGPWGVMFAVAEKEMRTITPREAAPFERIASHVHAALRLRFRLHGVPSVRSESPLDFRVGIDAIVSPNGKVEHAEADAQSQLESLKDAAIAIDRARARMRREDPEGALGAWRALVEGQWSLVESFESDGRRFLLARKNPPDAPRTPLLTERERAVLGLRARSHGVKLIAYELGLSPASVSRSLRSALQKLGVSSVGEIIPVLLGAANANASANEE